LIAAEVEPVGCYEGAPAQSGLAMALRLAVTVAILIAQVQRFDPVGTLSPECCSRKNDKVKIRSRI
jgi:hypothetical protein